MIVRLHPDADAELDEAAHRYEAEQAGLGVRFLEAYIDSVVEIEQHPQRFPYYHGLKLSGEVRRCLLARFPYQVVYEITDTEIQILAVAHAKRRPGYWTTRR